MSVLYLEPGEKATGQKVLLATTAYDRPAAGYTYAIANSREALHKAGIQTAYLLLSGNCHVDDARNKVVQEFLLTDCTDLVFLDADVSWAPEQLVNLCGFDADLVGGVYPYRREGKSDMPVLMFPDVTEPDERGLLDVAGLPTGFMRIRRNVIETLAKEADHYTDRTDRRSQVPILFERAFFNGIRLGGDLNFCKKWALKGGKTYAAVDLHLGHAAQTVIYDSLGAWLRRANRTTLSHLVSEVRNGSFDQALFAEAKRLIGNPFGVNETVLTLCSVMGRKADGPILEAGSGLSSIVLAASTKEPVYCLEHHPVWAAQAQDLIEQAGVSNVHIVQCGIRDLWYDVESVDLPNEFALALNDGPPRNVSDRMKFFERYGSTPSIICDDADESSYGNKLSEWAQANGRRIDFLDRAAIIREGVR